MALQTFFNQLDKLRRDPALSSIAPQMIQAINQEQPTVQQQVAPMSPQPTFPAGSPMVLPSPEKLAVAPMPVQSSLANVEAPAFPTGEEVRAMSQGSDPNLPVTQIQPEMVQNPAATGLIPGVVPSQQIAPQSVQTAQEIAALQEKQKHYGNKRNPDGSLYRNAEGNVEHGSARKEKWSTGDKIRNGVIGALTGFAQNGLGGAVAGAAMAGSNRNYQAQQSDRKILGQLQPQLTEQSNFEMSQARQRKADFDANNSQIEGQGKILTNAKTAGEITKLDVDTINSRIKPLLDTYSADKRIDAKEAETLTKLSGLPYNAAQWQTYIDKEVNGNILTRPEFDPRYTVNKTVPTDTGGVYRNVQIGKGAPIPVKTDNIPGLLISNEDRNAAREQSAYEFKTTQDRLDKQFSIETALKIQQYNTDQFGKFQGDMRGWQGEQVKAQGTIQKNAPLLSAYDQQIQKANDYLNSSQAKTDSVVAPNLVSQARAAVDRAKIEKQKAQGEIDAANYFLNSVPRPEQRPGISAPQVQPKNGSGKTATKAQVRTYAKQKGVSFAEAKKHAEDDGYRVQ